MIEKAIVTFIDILGYKNIIEKHMHNLTVIQNMELVFAHSTMGLLEKIKDRPFIKSVYQEYKNKIVDLIKIRVISDTIIFTIPISDISFKNPVEEGKTISDCIVLYFYFISMFSTLFISRTGCLLRGGIAIGPHYESDLKKGNGNFFIFSRAYVDAYLLEKKSENPRIVIDSKLISYLTELPFEDVDRFIFQDVDGKRCFNFYAHIDHISDNYKMVLSEIKKALELQMTRFAKDAEILAKLNYFARYHNTKVSEQQLNCKELTIKL